MVREIELSTVRIVKNAVGDETAFLRLPFNEAIQAFELRGILSPDEIYKLSETYQAQGEIAARLLLQRINERVRQVLREQVTQGIDFAEFARKVRDAEANLGIEPQSPWYLETVFRANVGNAYGAGRERQMFEDDAVLEALPFWQYRTAGDPRVRPGHVALDGLIFDKLDEEKRRLYPPNGFGCRCVGVSLGQEYASRVVYLIPRGGGADKGWDSSPLESLQIAA